MALVIAVGLCCVPARAAEALKFAFLGSLSGPFALQGEETLKSLQAAADVVNARGGVGGKKIEIVAFDNKGSPQESLIALKQAIDQDIRYIVSGVSNVAHALTDAIAKHNARSSDRPVLFLDYGALDPALTEAKCNFWHFRFEPHADTQLDVLTRYMAKQADVRKVYLINQDYAFGQAVSRSGKEMLAARRPDIQIVGDELIPFGKVKDFAPYVAKIRASGADSVLTGNWGNDLSLLIKAGNESNLNVTYYTLLATFFGTPSLIGPHGVDHVKTITPWDINVADAGRQKALLEAKAKYKALSNLNYLPAYRVFELTAEAAKKAGSIDPPKVARALEGLHWAGPSGDSWMRADDHQMVAAVYIMSWVKAGQPGAKYDAEGSGHGWKSELLIPAKDATPAVKCQMERPG
ncbi:MAG TPA: branched-chain amino acid ABC transporter substrate-binding protein [Burkholderiales bacterium]|nr:branched-chain amino acid ABC transporter substrate-binding protein [Burkholderiales bacterium]